MHSEWKVTSQYIGDEKMYAVYRLRDINAVDHSGNREYAGGYTSCRDVAVTVAEILNKAEEVTNGDD